MKDPREVILQRIAELQADLEAYDRLAAKYGHKNEPAISSASSTQSPDTSGFSTAGAVRSVIASFGPTQPFTKGDVLKALKQAHPAVNVNEASVASVLSKLGKATSGDRLYVVMPGSGKKAAVFQREPKAP